MFPRTHNHPKKERPAPRDIIVGIKKSNNRHSELDLPEPSLNKV